MTQDGIAAAEPGSIRFLLIVAGSALAYTAAMIAMKSWAKLPELWVGAAIVLFMVLAVAMEIVILRTQRLGMIYVSILAVEVVLIALVTTLVFKESYSMREVAGCGLVILGAGLAWS